MSLRDFQHALSQLYLDPSWRRSFFLSPAKAIGSLDIEPREKRALKGIGRVSLERFCRGLELKGSARLEAAFRRSARLMGRSFAALYRDFSGRHAQLRDWPEKLEAFADLVFHEFRSQDRYPPQALELARFERDLALLQQWARGALRVSALRKAAISRCPQSSAPPGLRKHWLGGFVGRYGWDVLGLARAGRRPSHALRGKTAVLFYQAARHGRVRTVRLEERNGHRGQAQ